jgi:pimeloyl-ACP methyl ester carboxylesterase
VEFETIKLEIDGVDTVIKAIGGGPAIFALHGAATIEGHEWARRLANRFRVYLPFHPGCGESGSARHICGMQDLVVHNLRLVAALGLDRPHLVGHSMGGWMAAEVAAVAGERFARLVLNAPVGLNHPDHRGADLSRVSPQDLPRYLAHRVEFGPILSWRIARSSAGAVHCGKGKREQGAEQYSEGARHGTPKSRSMVKPDTQRNSHHVGR